MYDVSRTIVEDRLRAAERRRLARSVRQQAASAADVRRRSAAKLRAVLGRTDGLPPTDAPVWSELAATAAAVTGQLAAAGHLPPHLVARPDERPAVLARLLLAALRRLDRGGAGSALRPGR